MPASSTSAATKYTDLAKLAGILIEGRPQERWLVVGIGLNVALDLAELPRRVARHRRDDGPLARGDRADARRAAPGARAAT